MKKAISLLFIFLLGFLNSQNLDLKKIEAQVQQNNQIGKQLTSQKQLINLLEQNHFTMEEQAKVNLLLAMTFRSINDYKSFINYLKKSETFAEDLNVNDLLPMSISAEMAFTYFDNHDYNSAEKIIKNITEKKYINLKLIDKAYIIMQSGYINFLKKNYNLAEFQYEASLKILEKHSPCNRPVVMVKQMQLFGRLNFLEKVDPLYDQIMSIRQYTKDGK